MKVSDLLTVLNQGWIGSIIGLIGAVLGFFGFLAYRNSRIGARPVYLYHSRRLIGKSEQELPKEVEVFFKKQIVARLSLSHIILWNTGTLSISGQDVVQSDPIRIEYAPGDDILEVNVIKTTRSVNNFKVTKNETLPHCAQISFDYLDPNDGATIEILHTSSYLNPLVLGTIKGVPKGLSLLGDIGPITGLEWRFKASSILLSLVIIILCVSFLITGLSGFADFGISVEGILIIIVGLIGVGLGCFLLLKQRRIPRALQTKDM
jgi:hypothetical protein